MYMMMEKLLIASLVVICCCRLSLAAPKETDNCRWVDSHTCKALFEINKFLENSAKSESFVSATSALRAALDSIEKGNDENFPNFPNKNILKDVLEDIIIMTMSDCDNELIDELIAYEATLIEGKNGATKPYATRGLTLALETQHLRMFEACKRSAQLAGFLTRDDPLFKESRSNFVKFANHLIEELGDPSAGDVTFDGFKELNIDSGNLAMMKASLLLSDLKPGTTVSDLILKHFIKIEKYELMKDPANCQKVINDKLVNKYSAYRVMMENVIEPIEKLVKYNPEFYHSKIPANQKDGRKVFEMIEMFNDFTTGNKDAGNVFILQNMISLVIEHANADICK